MTVQEIIKNKPYLAWSTPLADNLSEKVVLEQILNYGSWTDFKKFLKIKGLNDSAKLFKETLEKKRLNYRPEIENYFQLYFKKNAPGSFE